MTRSRANTIVTIRHGHQNRLGENYDDSIGGPLSELGQRQVLRARERLLTILEEMGGIVIAGCVSSDLPRAVETAEILTADFLPPDEIVKTRFLRERRLGILDHTQQHTDPRFREFKQDALHAQPAGSEQLLSLVRGRLQPPIALADELCQDDPQAAVIISAHGTVNQGLLHHYTGMSNRQLTFGPLVQGIDAGPLKDPGSIKNGQMHIYTLPDPGAAYYDVRTLGVFEGSEFDSGPIIVERD